MIDSRLRFVRTSMLTRLLLVLSVAVLIASAPACDNTTSSAPTPTPLQITEKPAPAPPPPITPVAQQPIFVVFESMSGKIRIQLHTKEAPRICANFLNLIQRGYYTRKQWDDFSPVVRQLGERVDINAIPYSLPREFAPKLLFDIGGRLCLANTTENDDARGHPYRIFLTVKPQERWNLEYVVFGTIVDGLDVATRMNTGEPVTSIVIEGDTQPLLTAQAKNIAQWNAALDARK
jgi:cyclophilin family peptidyl-prolyl cis-trans isomerase